MADLTQNGAEIIPDPDAHRISLGEARTRIQKFRTANDANFLASRSSGTLKIKGGAFHRKMFEEILKNDDVSGIRYYFAMVKNSDVEGDESNPNNFILSIVLIGVDKDGNDIRTEVDGKLAFGGDNSWPCPPHCSTMDILTP